MRITMVMIQTSTGVLMKEESSVVEVDMILWAVDKVQQDPDKRGNTEMSAVGMVEFEESSNLMVHFKKPITVDFHTMEVSTVEEVFKYSRMVVQVENHMVEVLMIHKFARLLVQLKLSMLVCKSNKDPDKKKCMEGCFEYQVDPENLYRVKGAQSREERKHRRRRSKQEEMRSKGQVMMRDKENMKDRNMTKEGQVMMRDKEKMDRNMTREERNYRSRESKLEEMRRKDQAMLSKPTDRDPF